MRDCFLFHPGTQHSWQTALALQELGRLQSFNTSIFYQPKKWPYRIERYLPGPLKRRIHSEFRRFQHPTLDPNLVRTAGLVEWLERLARRGGARKVAERIDRFGNIRFAHEIIRNIVRDKPSVLWGYDNSSIEAFHSAKELGITRILDRTNGDWRAYNSIMAEVYDQYSEFFLHKNFKVSEERIARNQREFELADIILTGSMFAADTLTAHAGTKVAANVRVLNYCFDEALFSQGPSKVVRSYGAPLRFLFVGQAGVRKGIHLVLKTFARISPSAASITIVGDLQVPPAIFAKYADRVEYLPTVARADIPALMASADVFLFPTHFEGAGIVLYEALASGLAIIQSKNADLAVTPDTGLLMPDNNEESLFTAVMTAIDDRPRVSSWQAAAPKAARRYSFESYRCAIAELLRDVGS